jgi:hypothetical protein
MNPNELIVKSEDGGDRVGKTKTIYDVGPGEIIWKNFLAGFSRGVGGIFVYLIFIVIIGGIFINTILPKILPLFSSYMNIFNSLGGSGNSLPQNFDIQKLLGQ